MILYNPARPLHSLQNSPNFVIVVSLFVFYMGSEFSQKKLSCHMVCNFESLAE